MRAIKKHLSDKLKHYHFELKHLLVLLAILIFSQVLVSFVHKISLQKFLRETQKWYQRDFAERLANLTATSLELVLETTLKSQELEYADQRKIIQAFNIILTQQLLQHHVQDVCILTTNSFTGTRGKFSSSTRSKLNCSDFADNLRKILFTIK